MNLPAFTTRVYFDDTDAAGVVYHANYLKIFERARNDQFLALGFDHLSNYKETGDCFVVKSLEIDYLSPARLGDEITVKSEVLELTKIRIIIGQTMVLSDKLLAKQKVTLIWINNTGKPTRMTQTMINLISSTR